MTKNELTIKIYKAIKWPFIQIKRLLNFIIGKPFIYLKNKGFFKVGLYIVVLTFLFSISQNLNARSQLSFQFRGYAGGIVDKKVKAEDLYYQTNHEGIIANHSQVKNTITNISLIVWDDPDKKEHILRDSMGPSWMIDERTGQEIKLPLIIEGKEAIKVQIFNKFPFEGTDKDLILTEKPTQPGSVFYIHKYNYELTFTDINGNEFDEHGKLINRDVIDLNWTLSNVCDEVHYKKWPCREEKLKIVYVKVMFKIRNIFHWLGLENVGSTLYDVGIPRAWVIRP